MGRRRERCGACPIVMRRGRRCWGIGLGRTGTNSFCRALQILGYERVVHNPVFERLRELDGGADNGVVVFYKYLDYKFPGSKFVLTHRPLESWLASMEWLQSRIAPVTRANDHAILRRMAIYETVTFEREKYAAGYERHLADVRRYFRHRPDDLLEMSFFEGDGWKRCARSWELRYRTSRFRGCTIASGRRRSTGCASSRASGTADRFRSRVVAVDGEHVVQAPASGSAAISTGSKRSCAAFLAPALRNIR